MVVNDNLNNPKDFFEDLAFCLAATGIAVILGIIFHVWSGYMLGTGTAFGAELQTVEQQTLHAPNEDCLTDAQKAKWQTLVEFFHKLGKSEEEAGQETSSDSQETGDRTSVTFPVAQKKAEMLASYIQVSNRKISSEHAATLAKSIIRWSEAYSLPVGLTAGVMYAESNFNINAKGSILPEGSYAIGPMQVMWPLHQGLAKTLGVKAKQDMFGDLGVKVGCCLLSGYCRDENSTIGGLKRYLASLNKTYILEKVFLTWMIIDRLNSGGIGTEEIEEVRRAEQQYMKKLLKR